MVLLRLLLLIQFMNENQKCNSALKSVACNYTYAHMLFFGCFKHRFSASKIAFAAANCLHELMCAWAYVVMTSQVGVKFAKSKSSGQYDRATQNPIDSRGHRTFDVLFYKFCDPSCHWPAQSMCFCDSPNHRVDNSSSNISQTCISYTSQLWLDCSTSRGWSVNNCGQFIGELVLNPCTWNKYIPWACRDSLRA